MPGSTVIRWFGRSTSSTRFMRVMTMSTPSGCGRAPAESPVPWPRATNGTPSWWQSRTTPCTCPAVSGSTAARGRERCETRPSDS